MTVEAAKPISLLRRLYDWCVAAAGKRHALAILTAVAFVESSFFPIPPDVMLVPMSLARPGWLINLYGYGDKVEAFRAAYAQWGAWIILIKGLTPIPYKIVTITSGFAGYNFGLFVVLSVITRGMRFFLLAFLLNRYGELARHIIEKRLALWTSLFAAVLVIGIVVALYLI